LHFAEDVARAPIRERTNDYHDDHGEDLHRTSLFFLVSGYSPEV
jgi:hypothetical protein